MDGDPELWTCDRVAARLHELGTRTAVTLPAHAVPPHFRPSAVLLLITCDGGQPSLVLTERAAALRAHPSEICLPGGRVEEGETVVEAALREGTEELGIDLSGATVVGVLDEGWTGTAHTVAPVVAWHPAALPAFILPVDEVADAFTIPLARLAEPTAYSVNVVEYNGHVYHDDVLEVDGCRVYGPTADAIVDLLAWLTLTQRERHAQRVADLIHFSQIATQNG